MHCHPWILRRVEVVRRWFGARSLHCSQEREGKEIFFLIEAASLRIEWEV